MNIFNDLVIVILLIENEVFATPSVKAGSCFLIVLFKRYFWHIPKENQKTGSNQVMPDESKEDEVQLPTWYLKLEKAAGKLSAGCIAAELIIFFGVKHIFSDQVIQVIQALLVPFGLVCVVLSGYNGLDTINNMLEVLKKIKREDK